MQNDNYIYALDAKPPFYQLVLLGLQHVVKFSLLLICPVLIINATHGGSVVAINVISMSLIAGAVATLLMALRTKWLGAGCFIPAQASVPFFAALLISAKLGGMPLVFGMSIVAGLLQFLLSFLFPFVKKIFNETLAGFVILILGMWAALLGVSELFRPGQLGQLIVHSTFISLGPIQTQSAIIGFIALAVMITLRLLKRGRLYCILVGMLIGWLLSWLSGGLLPERLLWLQQAPWFALPHFFSVTHIAFDWHLLLPMIIVALTASCEVFALVATIENLETTQWHCNWKKIRSGNCAAGIGAMLSGLLGGVAQSPIPGSIGDLIATGAHNRTIAYLYAPILILLAFCPKLALLFLTIPAAVNGAAIIFMGAVMLMQGLSMLHIDKLKEYQVHAFGLAFLLAFSADVFPAIFLQGNNILVWSTNYDLTLGFIIFIVLQLLFRLGQKHG